MAFSCHREINLRGNESSHRDKRTLRMSKSTWDTGNRPSSVVGMVSSACDEGSTLARDDFRGAGPESAAPSQLSPKPLSIPMLFL